MLRFDTRRTCLDLLATVGGNLSSSPVERLDRLPRLSEWLRRSNVLPDDVPSPGDVDHLNRLAAVRSPASRLVVDAVGYRRRTAATPTIGQLVAAVSEDAIGPLSSADRSLLRECEGPDCDLVYLDGSRGPRRRWCSAATCGNRHHVAAHRSRRSGDGST